MSFLFGSTTPTLSLGLELLERSEKEFAERKKRWDSQIATFGPIFIGDVKTVLLRELVLHPEDTSFNIYPNDIVTDKTLYSKKTFDYICGSAEKKLNSDEIWTLMHKVLRPYITDQDMELDIYDDKEYVTISFHNAKRIANERIAAAAKAAAKAAEEKSLENK